MTYHMIGSAKKNNNGGGERLIKNCFGGAVTIADRSRGHRAESKESGVHTNMVQKHAN